MKKYLRFQISGHCKRMTTNELQQFIKNNAQLIANAVNKYTAECNIKFSEFSEEQQNKLKLGLAAIEAKKIICHK